MQVAPPEELAPSLAMGVTMQHVAAIVVPLALADALARKRPAPAGPGTLRTDTPTFAVLLTAVIVLVGALTFLPAFLLGPAVQGLTGGLY